MFLFLYKIVNKNICCETHFLFWIEDCSKQTACNQYCLFLLQCLYVAFEIIKEVALLHPPLF